MSQASMQGQWKGLLEGEEGSTHLNGTTEGHLAISLAEVHVSHAQVGSLNEHREVHLPPYNSFAARAADWLPSSFFA